MLLMRLATKAANALHTPATPPQVSSHFLAHVFSGSKTMPNELSGQEIELTLGGGVAGGCKALATLRDGLPAVGRT